jgi:Uma2 family endonuclease
MVSMSLVTTPTPGSLSLADLEAMPDDGRRHELIGGAIVMTAAPAPIHQMGAARVHPILQAAVGEDHFVFAAPIDLDLPGGQRVEPDFVVVPWTSVGEQRLTLPVTLVVEIVSPGSQTNDRITKRAAYAAAGIPAYWLIDLPARVITLLTLTATGVYQTLAEGPTVTATTPLAVTLDLDQLTRRPSPGGSQQPPEEGRRS